MSNDSRGAPGKGIVAIRRNSARTGLAVKTLNASGMTTMAKNKLRRILEPPHDIDRRNMRGRLRIPMRLIPVVVLSEPLSHRGAQRANACLQNHTWALGWQIRANPGFARNFMLQLMCFQ